MRLLVLFALMGVATLGARASDPATNLTADEVIARFVERARTATNRLPQTRLAFLRRTTLEQFNSKGVSTERKVKEQWVEMLGPEQSVKLLKLNGQAPSNRDNRRETADERDQQKRFTTRSDRGRRSANADFVDERLIRRFTYEVEGVEVLEGRTVFRLKFSPQGRRESKEIADRILERLAGHVWIDAEEFELVKLDAQLAQELNIFGGIAGALENFDLRLNRRRLPDGTWVNLLLDGKATGRKVFVRFDSRMRVEQEDFRPFSDTASP